MYRIDTPLKPLFDARDYDTLQAALTAAIGATLVINTSQTVGAITVPASTRVLVAPGVTLTRSQPTTGIWVTVSADAEINGGDWNGNKASAAAYNKNYRAIDLAAGAKLRNATVRDNNGHGVALAAGAICEDVASNNHGNNPGSSGTGDGFYVNDVLNTRLVRCTADDNARMGFTVTSNSAAASATLIDCAADGNGYLDYDFEYVAAAVTVVARKIDATGGIAVTGADVTIQDFTAKVITAGNGGAATAKTRLSRGVISGQSGAESLNLEAHTIIMRDVTVAPTDSGTSWCVSLKPSVVGVLDGFGISGTVYNGLNLVAAGVWQTVRGVWGYGSATNRYLNVLGRRGFAASRFQLRDGRFYGQGEGPPDSALWDDDFVVGDVIEYITTAAGGYMGCVCTTAGTPGTFKTYGSIAS